MSGLWQVEFNPDIAYLRDDTGHIIPTKAGIHTIRYSRKGLLQHSRLRENDTIHHSPFTIHHSPFTIHHSPFTIRGMDPRLRGNDAVLLWRTRMASGSGRCRIFAQTVIQQIWTAVRNEPVFPACEWRSRTSLEVKKRIFYPMTQLILMLVVITKLLTEPVIKSGASGLW